MGLRKNKKDRADEVPTHHMIAQFMSVSAPLEEYLRQGKPLTHHEIELISLTVTGLQTFLDVWKRKNNVPIYTKSSS
jgi:hypothetical protein